MRGRAQLIECCFCGRRIPSDKAIRFTRYGFSYYDDRMGIQHRGVSETEYCCPSCGRHRHIQDARPRVGRPKYR